MRAFSIWTSITTSFCAIWSCIFTETLIPESLLDGIAARYRLLLLSNTNAIHFEMLRANYAPLLRHFHELVLSYEVKAMKPQPEIYRSRDRTGGLPPRGVLLSPTTLPAYVAAARRDGNRRRSVSVRAHRLKRN